MSLVVILVTRYLFRRYTSCLTHAPVAETNNFWLATFGLVPPPSDGPDLLSQFLIKSGQDRRQTPISVVWSIMGTPLVIVNSLKGIKDVLVDGQQKRKGKDKTAPTLVQRGDLIRRIQNHVFGGKNINNTVGEEWRWHREVLLPPFQPRQLVPNLMPYIARRAKMLLDTFDEYAENGAAAEVDELFQNLTMDVINYYLYGRSDLNYDMVGGRTNLKSVEAWLPFGLNKTRWAQRAYQPSRELLKDFIRDSLNRAIADDASPEKGDFRSVAACAFASGKYDHDREALVNDMLSLTFAGYDTTAHTLAFCFSELARHPEIQEALFTEVRQVLGPPPVDPASITADKLIKMPLVTAVFRETMRKYPAVVFIPVHVNEDTPVDGTIVPAGAEIWCNVRGLQMNPDVFPDPDAFNPLRWIKPGEAGLEDGFDALVSGPTSSSSAAATEVSAASDRNSGFMPDQQYNFPDISFTLGKHACLGKNLAILELRTVIASVVNQFTFSLKPGNVIETKVILTTKPRNGVWLHFERRVPT
ncbi:cytochrome P450 [Dichotomocladium elegans]|nr:cytochrome P450 [Dichotomocladium elegans]